VITFLVTVGFVTALGAETTVGFVTVVIIFGFLGLGFFGVGAFGAGAGAGGGGGFLGSGLTIIVSLVFFFLLTLFFSAVPNLIPMLHHQQ